MNDVGIKRFHITDKTEGKGAWRFIESKRRWPIANILYRSVFAELGIPLLPGELVIECTNKEFLAGYDSKLGIDVLLRPQGQGEITMQEKFLFTDFYTVTIEHCQDWLTLEGGDWYNLKAQYYFVGYSQNQRRLSFDKWILLDWPRLQRATAQGRIRWKLRNNYRDGARSSFMYVEFKRIAPDVIVKSSMERSKYESRDLRQGQHQG